MAESFRALLVIFVLSGPVFWLAREPITVSAIDPADFKRRSTAWLVLTAVAFVSNNFWLYAFIVSAMLLSNARQDSNRLAVFMFLLFLIPPFPVRIAGFAGLNQVLELTHPRLLSLLLLLPAWLVLKRDAATRPLGSALTDLCLLGFLLLQLGLQLANDTFTNTARYALYAFLDVFLPYYVASRSLRDAKACRDVVTSFVFAILLLAPLAVFEWGKHWLLYYNLRVQMDAIDWGMGGYLSRGESLRALVTTGHSLVLGYVMVVALALFSYSRRFLTLKWQRLGGAVLVAGLIAPVSRGPWVGAAVVFGVLSLMGPDRLSRIGKATAIALPLATGLLFSPAGDRIIDLLPFIGTVDEFNVTYRQRLFDASMTVVQHNLWFGSSDFLSAPEMQEMIQGEGIIDIVNSYLGIALSYGVVGLGLFCGAFASAAWCVWRGLRNTGPREELHDLGRALLAALAGVLVTIATVSSINNIPVVYWMLAGLCVGYADLVQKSRPAIDAASAATHAASPRSRPRPANARAAASSRRPPQPSRGDILRARS